jgi:uncharacterized protein (DUF2237 family)
VNVLLANLAVTLCLVGLIWTIQIVHYPLFAHVGIAEFSRYHALHSSLITLLVGPLMLAEVGLTLGWITEPGDVPRWLPWACAALVAVAWLSTALLSVPIHGALGAASPEERPALIARLVLTNWPRTLAWTARAALLLFALARRLRSPSPRNWLASLPSKPSTMARSLVLSLALLLAACRSHHPQGATPATSETAPRCELPAPGSLEPGSELTSIVGSPLQPCSVELRTGWFRNGTCNTDAEDRGVHVVCAQVTKEFLTFTRTRGNDLETPHPDLHFPGLKPGDRWCLCADRWKEALDAGVAPPVLPEATHAKALRHVSKQALLDHALSP